MKPLPIVKHHFEELREKYKGLSLIHWHGAWSVEGRLWFTASYNNKPIEDEYSVKILIPQNYPEQYPTSEETLGRIPKSFHHYKDGSLCLGAPYAISKTFLAMPTLFGFTEKCLIPYLYSFSYKSLYGYLPYGELTHGNLGILEYYQSELNVNNKKPTIEFLRILSENYKSTNIVCPCGSKKNISKCHGKRLREMLSIVSPSFFQKEYYQILDEIALAHNLTTNYPFHTFLSNVK